MIRCTGLLNAKPKVYANCQWPLCFAVVQSLLLWKSIRNFKYGYTIISGFI